MPQLEAPRKGIIIEEMTFVARREDPEPELIRGESATDGVCHAARLRAGSRI